MLLALLFYIVRSNWVHVLFADCTSHLHTPTKQEDKCLWVYNTLFKGKIRNYHCRWQSCLCAGMGVRVGVTQQYTSEGSLPLE